MDMWREMRAEGLKTNTIVYNSVSDASARCSFMDGVSELLSAMEADEVFPDLITCSTILKGYCVKGGLGQSHRSLQGHADEQHGEGFDRLQHRAGWMCPPCELRPRRQVGGGDWPSEHPSIQFDIWVFR